MVSSTVAVTPSLGNVPTSRPTPDPSRSLQSQPPSSQSMSPGHGRTSSSTTSKTTELSPSISTSASTSPSVVFEPNSVSSDGESLALFAGIPAGVVLCLGAAVAVIVAVMVAEIRKRRKYRLQAPDVVVNASYGVVTHSRPVKDNPAYGAFRKLPITHSAKIKSIFFLFLTI